MECLQTKDKIGFYPLIVAAINSAKSVTVAQSTVPFGTVGRFFGGTNWGVAALRPPKCYLLSGAATGWLELPALR